MDHLRTISRFSNPSNSTTKLNVVLPLLKFPGLFRRRSERTTIKSFVLGTRPTQVSSAGRWLLRSSGRVVSTETTLHRSGTGYMYNYPGRECRRLPLFRTLADADNRGKLNIQEFHVAMGLIYRRLYIILCCILLFSPDIQSFQALTVMKFLLFSRQSWSPLRRKISPNLLTFSRDSFKMIPMNAQPTKATAEERSTHSETILALKQIPARMARSTSMTITA